MLFWFGLVPSPALFRGDYDSVGEISTENFREGEDAAYHPKAAYNQAGVTQQDAIRRQHK